MSACSGERVVAIQGGADAGPDEVTLERQWGVYALSFAIDRCPDAGLLVVDTLADELEGGAGLNARAGAGLRLSLREALWLAANTPGQHLITFDPMVFAPSSGATISMTDDAEPFPPPLVDTCIDARGLSVIVDFQGCARNCAWSLDRRSQMIGLVLKGDMAMMRASDAVVAGNRFMVRGVAVQAANGAVIGPSNVFGHGGTAVRIDASASGATTIPSVEENSFGVEPATGADLGLGVAVSAVGRLRIINNVSNAAMELGGNEGGGLSANQLVHSGAKPPRVTLSGDGWLISQNLLGGGVENSPPAGQGNTVIQNIIDESLVSVGAVAPPTDGGVGSVSGTCPPVVGMVELYSHLGARWSPVAFTTCEPGAEWSLTSASLVPGVEVSTLFTVTTKPNTGPFSAPLTIHAP